MSEWKMQRLDEIIIVNPKESIKKYDVAIKVAMEDVLAYIKKIRSYKLETYNGGSKFRNGDTILARITPCLENGKSAYIDFLKDKEIAFGSTEFIVIRPIYGKAYPHFIYYLIQNKAFRDYAIKAMTGTSGRQRLEPNRLRSFPIMIPDYPTQKTIAEILSCYDDKIENSNKIIANFNAQIETLFKNWFIDYAPFADNLSEEGIPTGWKNSNVFDESEEVSERNKEDKEYPVLSVVKDGEFVLSEERFTKQVYSKEQTKYKIVSRNQIGFNPARANIGSIAMLTDFDIGLVSPIYIVFKLKNSILPTYFYYYMKRPVFLQNIQAQAIGTTRQNLSYEAFKLFPIVVPTEKAQKDFIDLITPMEQEIANQKKQIEKLANTRDTLLPKLMSGEIEVPVEE